MMRCSRTWFALLALGPCVHHAGALAAATPEQVSNSTPIEAYLEFTAYDPAESFGWRVVTELGNEVIVLFFVFCLGLLHTRFRRDKMNAHMPKPFCGRRPMEVGVPPHKLSEESLRRMQMREKSRLGDILGKHARNGNLQEMVQTLEQIDQRCPLCLDMTEYHTAIVHISRGGDPILAHKWLRRCLEIGLRPQHGAYTTVIRSYVRAGAFKEANAVAQEMVDAGLDFDTVTYNSLIHACLCGGDAGNAQMWMEKMLAEGVLPNAVSYATVMLACSSVGLNEDLDRWYALSQEAGCHLKFRTFDSMFGDFARRDDYVASLKWLNIMMEHGLQPDVNIFHRVLSPILRTGSVELADRLIGVLRGSGVQKASSIFNRCIQLAIEKGQHSKAQEWADMCVPEHGRLNEQARTAMMSVGLKVPYPKLPPIDKATASVPAEAI